MRVLIAAPRKSGNSQLRCLLAAAYELNSVGSRDVPDVRDASAVAVWFQTLPERIVVHCDYPFSRELAEMASRFGVTLVAVIRHPYDLFISIYEIAQRRGRRGKAGPELPHSWEPLTGRELDDDEVLAFLGDGFADEIAWLRDWHDSGAPLVRLELLEADPGAALAGLGAALGPLDENAVARAVAQCAQADVIYRHPGQGRRMPAIPAGSWRERLSDAHLSILRDRYGANINHLGYEAF